jgi:hypothetical protein
LSGKLAEQLPVCVIELATYTRLVYATGWANQAVPAKKKANFDNALLYTREEDENRVPIPKITKARLEHIQLPDSNCFKLLQIK